jgi:hypothetical protein
MTRGAEGGEGVEAPRLLFRSLSKLMKLSSDESTAGVRSSPDPRPIGSSEADDHSVGVASNETPGE